MVTIAVKHQRGSQSAGTASRNGYLESLHHHTESIQTPKEPSRPDSERRSVKPA